MSKNSDSLTNQAANQALWGGRFQEATDEFVERFNASVDFDKTMYRQDIAGSVAHATMLNKVGVLTDEEAQKIIAGLLAIEEKIEAGDFEWLTSREDVHMNIEAQLTQDIGDVGKKLHTGRSRNDQVATDIRLYLRDEIDQIAEQVTALQKGIVSLAKENANTIMPGFTHLQTAQPIVFGHHLLAWNEMLERDYSRLIDCRQRLNQSPLGAAALAGTTYPIDRNLTADLLGFDHPTRNSLDSVSDRDFAIEFTSFASILLMHLSRFAEEMIIWTSAQFDFIELPDRYCTGSSIMPQKKNPDIPELVRGKSGRVYGHLMSLLTLMKSQPLAYNKDNQEDKEPLFDTVRTVSDCLKAYGDMIPNIKPKTESMLVAAKSGFSTATDLADYLVRKGVAFRDSHEIVGNTVAFCIQNELDLDALSLEQLSQFSDKIDDDVFAILTVEGSVAARNHLGGTAPNQVVQASEAALKSLNQR